MECGCATKFNSQMNQLQMSFKFNKASLQVSPLVLGENQNEVKLGENQNEENLLQRRNSHTRGRGVWGE